MIRLNCKIQHYLWGKTGINSIISGLTDETIEEDEHYAELWMGTHQNGAAVLKDTGKSLKDYIKQNAHVLGTHEGGDLQFLLKVLSVGNALSIQSHPTKEQAKILNANDPLNYPDDNHKPEMAIALSDFELLCGFQKPHGILSNVKAHKELLELLDEESLVQLAEETNEDKQRAALKKVFTQVWTHNQEEIKQVIQEIVTRLYQKDQPAQVDEIVLRLNDQFPGDIGVLAPFFLNYFTLKPGEATFLGPNEPHAYISGNCIECMALSDNTIRAGLTPKFKDVNTLCNSLTYRMYDPPIFKPKILFDGIFEYAPPIDEFRVHMIKTNASEIPAIPSASIFIIVEGGAQIQFCNELEAIKKGDVFFLPKQLSYSLSNQSSNFEAYRAFTPRK